MTIQFLQANQAYVIMFGDEMIQLHNSPMFFESIDEINFHLRPLGLRRTNATHIGVA